MHGFETKFGWLQPDHSALNVGQSNHDVKKDETHFYEHFSEYIPIRDRQRFGTTSGLRYFMKIRTDNDQDSRIINAHSLLRI